MGIKDPNSVFARTCSNSISKGNLSQFTSQFPQTRRLRAAIDTIYLCINTNIKVVITLLWIFRANK